MQWQDEPEWRTIDQVNSNQIFAKVNVGDDVAITQVGEDDWLTGIVVAITTYKDRVNRYQERPALEVDCQTPIKERRTFYEHCVHQILFKD